MLGTVPVRDGILCGAVRGGRFLGYVGGTIISVAPQHRRAWLAAPVRVRTAYSDALKTDRRMTPVRWGGAGCGGVAE